MTVSLPALDPRGNQRVAWPFARAQYLRGDWPSPVNCPSHTLQSQKITYLGKGKVGKKEGRDGREEEREGGSVPLHLLHLRQVSATKHRGLSSSFQGIYFLPASWFLRHCILTDTRKAPESSVS